MGGEKKIKMVEGPRQCIFNEYGSIIFYMAALYFIWQLLWSGSSDSAWTWLSVTAAKPLMYTSSPWGAWVTWAGKQDAARQLARAGRAAKASRESVRARRSPPPGNLISGHRPPRR